MLETHRIVRTLSRTIDVSLWAASSAGPLLKSTPKRAPTPVPTMIAVGVASAAKRKNNYRNNNAKRKGVPTAQGQLTTRVERPNCSAKANGVRPFVATLPVAASQYHRPNEATAGNGIRHGSSDRGIAYRWPLWRAQSRMQRGRQCAAWAPCCPQPPRPDDQYWRARSPQWSCCRGRAARLRKYA
jgi:hypothetical protein